MRIDDNAEALAMMKRALGSLEGKIREAYNKGFQDGVKSMVAEDEPNSSEKPNNCEKDCFLCKWLGDVDVCCRCRNRNLFAEANTEPKPKDEPQKKEVEWVYNKRERLWYPYSNGELLFKDEPQTDCAWK